jgi:hypothetical protein
VFITQQTQKKPEKNRYVRRAGVGIGARRGGIAGADDARGCCGAPLLLLLLL